jgi:hypothetical protein
MVADKLVGKSFEWMGDLDLTYRSEKRSWTSEFKTRQGARMAWWYRIDGSDLIGGITTEAGDSLRKVSAQRYRP